MEDKQTRRLPCTVTVAFRIAPERKHLVDAVAARHGLLPSDWLRQVAEKALEEEGFLKRVNAPAYRKSDA